jgi:hypothetical protein
MVEEQEIVMDIVSNAKKLASYCQTQTSNISSVYLVVDLKHRGVTLLANLAQQPSENDKELLGDIGFNLTANFDELSNDDYIYKVRPEEGYLKHLIFKRMKN